MPQSNAKSDEQRVGSPSPQLPPASQEMLALAPRAAIIPAGHAAMLFEDAYFEISDITREWASLADAICVPCTSDDDSDAVSEMLQLEHPDSSSPSVASLKRGPLALQGPAAIRPGDGAQSSPTRHGADVSPSEAAGNLYSVGASTHAGVVPGEIGVAAAIRNDDIRTDQHSDAGVASSPALRNNTPQQAIAPNAPTRSSPPNTSCGLHQPVMHHNIPPSAQSPVFPATDVSNRALLLHGPPSACGSSSTHSHPSSPRLSLHHENPPPSLPPNPVPSTAPVSQSPQSGRTFLPRASSASSASTFAHRPVELHLGDQYAHRTRTPPQDTLEVVATVRPDFPGPARTDFATELTVKADPAPALTIAQLARRARTPAPHATALPDSAAEAKLQRQLLAARARTTPRQKSMPAPTRRTGTIRSPESPPSTHTSEIALSSHAGRSARVFMPPRPSPFCPSAPPANTTAGRAHAGVNRNPSLSSPSGRDASASSESHSLLSSDRIPWDTQPNTTSADTPQLSHVEFNPFGDAARPDCAPFAMSQPHDAHSTRASLAHQLASARLPQKPTWPFETQVAGVALAGVARPRERAVHPSQCTDPRAGTTSSALQATPTDLAPHGAAFVPAPLPAAGPAGGPRLLLPVDASIERRVVSRSSCERPALSPASQLAHEPSSTVATRSPAPDALPAAASGASADRRRSSSVATSRLDHSAATSRSHRDHAGNSSSSSPPVRFSYEPPPLVAPSNVAVKAERSCSPASSDYARSAHSHKPALLSRIRTASPSDDEGSRSPSPPGAQIPLLPRISAATPGPLIQRVGPRPEAKKKKNKKRKRKQSNEDQDVDGSEDSQAHAPKKQRR